MSYWAFSGAAIQGLSREHWGVKIPGGDGQAHDSGVQAFVDELLARLQSQDPIKLLDTIKLIAPSGQPAITIINDGDGDPPPPPDFGGITGSVQLLASVVVSSVDTSGLTVNTSGLGIDESGLSIDITVDGCDVTAELTGDAVITGSATISGTITITLTPTYITLSFVNGLLMGVS